VIALRADRACRDHAPGHPGPEVIEPVEITARESPGWSNPSRSRAAATPPCRPRAL